MSLANGENYTYITRRKGLVPLSPLTVTSVIGRGLDNIDDGEFRQNGEFTSDSRRER